MADLDSDTRRAACLRTRWVLRLDDADCGQMQLWQGPFGLFWFWEQPPAGLEMPLGVVTEGSPHRAWTFDDVEPAFEHVCRALAGAFPGRSAGLVAP